MNVHCNGCLVATGLHLGRSQHLAKHHDTHGIQRKYLVVDDFLCHCDVAIW